jgi:hypothetical protein
VLWGRLLLGEGKNDEARQRLESALSFEDGSEAWSLLIAERLLAEDMKQARWLRKQVVQLSGPPALRAWVHQGWANSRPQRRHSTSSSCPSNGSCRRRRSS